MFKKLVLILALVFATISPRLALAVIRCLLIGCCAISPNVRAQGACALSHGTVGHILPNEHGRDLFG